MRRAVVFLAFFAVVASACGLKVPLSIEEAGELSGGAGGGGSGSLAAGAGADGSSADGTVGGARGATGAAGRAAGGAAGGAAGAIAGGSIFPNDTEGLTNTSIKICTHVPITGAAPVDRNPKRFGAFYFDWLNRTQGGIHGREVEYIVFDDRYNPANAVQAAEACKDEGAFVIAGAAGTDQLVAVAKWAADNKVPYLMGPASVKDVAQYTPYAKMVGPDYEFQHELLADYLVGEFGKDVNYGMIRVASPFFDAAHDAYVAQLRTHGIELVVDEVVQKDENLFTGICNKLFTENVKVVNNFTTPVHWLKMLNQCPETYKPTWTAVSPAAGFNLVAEILTGEDAGDALVFHHFNPAYPATRTDFGGTLDAYSYKDDILRFQEVFATCGVCASEGSQNGKTPRDDIDWSAYLASKGIHRLLEAAGRDITRTKLWTMLRSYQEAPAQAAPSCPADFTRGADRGAWYVNVFKLGTRQWDNVSLCLTR
jgi:ABC-type branched-subunit amino acid transport system substrate-binding protein